VAVVMVLLGLIAMYLNSEKALTPEKEQAKNARVKFGFSF